MVATFGTSCVGKVDRVPGKGYVVTKVFQIINVPLLPLGGYLVREGTEPRRSSRASTRSRDSRST